MSESRLELRPKQENPIRHPQLITRLRALPRPLKWYPRSLPYNYSCERNLVYRLHTNSAGLFFTKALASQLR